MSVINRLRTMIRAEWQEVTASPETPIRQLNQTITALEGALVQFRQEATESAAGCRLLEHKLEETSCEREQRRADAETAIAAGNDELARQALRRDLSLQQVETSYRQQLKEARNLAEQMRADLLAFEARLDEAKVKRETMIARDRAARLRRTMAEQTARLDGIDDQIPDSDTSLAATFAAVDDEVARLDAATEAIREVVAHEPDRAFERLKLDQAVDDELAKLKSNPKPTPQKRTSARRRKGA